MTMLRDNVDEILDILKSEKIILYPTDTVWGIGCDSLSQEAYERIFALKGRPVNKSAILLVDSLICSKTMLSAFTQNSKIYWYITKNP